MSVEIENLSRRISELSERNERLKNGEQLSNDYHWSGYPAYELYCVKCKTHIMEFHDPEEVPFAEDDDAKCSECQKSPEQKEAETEALNQQVIKSDINKLKLLIEKYPNYLELI